jgi:hypothetical protein
MGRSGIKRRHGGTRRSLVVGSEGFVEQVKNELSFTAQHRAVLVADSLYTLREPVPLYSAISIGKMRL